MDMKTKTIELKIDFRKGSKFKGSDGEEYGAYRTVTRKVKHLFMWQYETILEIRIPEIKDSEGKIEVIPPGFIDK